MKKKELTLPALRINLLPKRDFKANQDFKFSQFSLRQQQTTADDGSGEGTREKLAKVAVMMSSHHKGYLSKEIGECLVGPGQDSWFNSNGSLCRLRLNHWLRTVFA